MNAGTCGEHRRGRLVDTGANPVTRGRLGTFSPAPTSREGRGAEVESTAGGDGLTEQSQLCHDASIKHAQDGVRRASAGEHVESRGQRRSQRTGMLPPNPPPRLCLTSPGRPELSPLMIRGGPVAKSSLDSESSNTLMECQEGAAGALVTPALATRVRSGGRARGV